MRIGILVSFGKNTDIEEKFKMAKEMEIYTCQLNSRDATLYTRKNAEAIRQAADKYGIEITAFWCGWSGPQVWDFYKGPSTLGLVPEEYRTLRMDELKKGSDFTKFMGVKDMITHVGFIPETPECEEYKKLIPVICEIAEYAASNGQHFLFETGQETPITLLRTIEEVGTGNLGINLDPANLLMYGKANPIDALEVLGKYVRGVHGKDGFYPTNGKELGCEVRLGEGRVNYPAFVEKLKEIGYDGAITIEREVSGEEQRTDIIYAKKYLDKLI